MSALRSIRRAVREFEDEFGPGSVWKDGLLCLLALAALFANLAALAALAGPGQ
ncbi:MAG: hypothetical protein AB7L36_00680 [Sphingomonadaceae bacterium]